MNPRLKRLIPWTLSVAIVGWLFWSVDVGEVWGAIRAAALLPLLGIVLGFSVLVFFADSATMAVLYRRLLTPVTYREFLPIRGVSYFLGVINYNMATGAIAYLMHRRKQQGFLECLSALLWLNFVDIIALLVMLMGGLALGSHLLPPAFAARLPVIVGVSWALVAGALLYWNGGFDFLVLGRLRRWRLFSAWSRARLVDYALMTALRIAFIFVYLAMNYFVLPTFGIHVGFAALVAYIPLLTFMQIVPASISGLGAVTVVSIALYEPHVAAGVADPRAQILAMSTVVGPLTSLVRLVIGYLFVARVTRDFLPKATDIAAARQASGAPLAADAPEP